MAIYIVGDIQGCFNELQALLDQVAFNPTIDELWPAGDIVARGPDSLKTLRFIKSLGAHGKMVLGNHDLHLLATFAGIKKAKKNDLLADVFAAPDAEELMDWLAQQPLLRKIPNEHAYVSHAGITPEWNVATAVLQAREAEQKIASANRDYWLSHMYGEQPNTWQSAKSEVEKFRFTINSFTRMRFCHVDGSLEFAAKGAPAQEPELKPWYELSNVLQDNIWLFGHWASLMGNTGQKNLFALDTGCVWGNSLTLLRWHDKQLFSQTALSN